MNESALLLGSDASLAAVVTDPEPGAGAPQAPAVLWLSAGFLHRVGPNRLYVTMARRLAALGFTSVRFDFSGIGDSPPRRDHLPFDEGAVRDTREVIDWLAEHRGIDRVVLAGVCSGASVALWTASCDARVVGVALVNAGGLERSEEWNVFVGNRAETRRQ